MNARQPFAAVLAALIVAAGGLVPIPAWTQANLDAGKSPAKIYAQGCGACHATPHELHDVRRDFLLEHYTTGPEQAALIADISKRCAASPGRSSRAAARALRSKSRTWTSPAASALLRRRRHRPRPRCRKLQCRTPPRPRMPLPRR